GRHQATFRCQPPEGSHRCRRGSASCVRLHALPQGRQGHQVL
ncbi:MAG: LSU ribosomal protein L28p @ LSU ribosomal protein L28p, zinc-dependent, partial [uncultured Solirubrobacteraceae bacterium]